ncbi:hypothetical protein JL804_00440 [Staphylococcus pseudintermedius]|nr:hypothetical protein [Staphylococcus pseudintermedius]MCE5605719.1 hypothetical protein [Staphylococcus pseudintermedius]MCE5607573.1 hypothetical protein [Staphylococcus pseudintermedius]MCE5612622.1 hypothetical protein [Staphylococcus pseudintermedius]MCE5706772.1 hypothetical protein [Staphylococcus pseudintermedius]
MKIYDNGDRVYIQPENELEEEVIRDNAQKLEDIFDEMVSEAIKNAQR